jgi:hypothetical protein
MINSIALSLVALTPSASSNGLLSAHFENVLGTSLDLKIIASSEVAASAAESKILSEILSDSGRKLYFAVDYET